MNGGADVDIITGMPLEMAEAERKKEADARAEAADLRRAGWASVSESEAAKALESEIHKILMDRFEAFLVQDPAGGAAMRMLSSIKVRDFTAKHAANKIAERVLRRGEK